MNELQINTRKSILNTLNLLASFSQQLEYKNSVPFINVTQELVEQWNNHNILKNKDWYIEIWTENEYFSLEEFNKHFQDNLKSMPKRLPDVPDILENKAWIQIMELANSVDSCFIY